MILCLWFQLKTVETLLGNTAKVREVIVLGMITQLKEVSCYLLLDCRDHHSFSARIY